MIPKIETERLILRQHRMSDFDAYAEMWSEPDVVRFVGGKPFDREASWSRFLRHAGIWHYLGFGFFAIEEKATGQFIGEAGFHDLCRALTPSLDGSLEAGWALASSGQGWGYATEAMTAVIGWASGTYPDRRMTCIINVDNLPSLRVAARLGFRDFARTEYHGTNVAVLERCAEAMGAPTG